MRTAIVCLALAGCAPVAPAADEADTSWEIGKSDRGDRAAWVLSEIDAANAALDDDTRAAKYEKMSESAHAFFRATNHLFWADLARDRRLREFGGSDARTFLVGDLHTENFGSYADDRGEVVYGPNDFDEALIADYQLDLWRLAASVALVAEANSLSTRERDDALESLARSYAATLTSYRGNKDEDDAVFTAETSYGPLDNFLEEVEAERDRARLLDKWTEVASGARRFKAHEELAAVDAAEVSRVRAAVAAYGATLSGGLRFSSAYFAVKSVARRLDAGLGSLGRARYYLLVEGSSRSLDDDLILDVKAERAPVGLAYLKTSERDANARKFPNPAARAALAFRALDRRVDDHVGWLKLAGDQHFVRELSPRKDTLKTDELDADDLVEMCEQWGAILASAHARADRDFDANLVSTSFEAEADDRIGEDLDGFVAQVAKLGKSYAAQVKEDFAVFRARR